MASPSPAGAPWPTHCASACSTWARGFCCQPPRASRRGGARGVGGARPARPTGGEVVRGKNLLGGKLARLDARHELLQLVQCGLVAGRFGGWGRSLVHGDG